MATEKPTPSWTTVTAPPRPATLGDVKVPMRDNVHLATDIWLPSKTPAAALLVRIPYNKSVIPEMPMVPHKGADC
jgi:predicted acyl esterase